MGWKDEDGGDVYGDACSNFLGGKDAAAFGCIETYLQGLRIDGEAVGIIARDYIE